MPISRSLIVLFALVTFMTATLAHLPVSAEAAVPTSPASVITWNNIARRAALQVATQTTGHAMASIALAQAAVYDAVVAIEGGYQPYQTQLPYQPDASLDAAVSSAAHAVLVRYFPAQQAALDADYAAMLAVIADGPAKTDGIAIGKATAAGIIAARQGDGWEANIGFTMPAPAPGVWQLPAGQNPMTPWFSKLRPFLIERPDQFRPGPPTALSSQEWVDDYNEIKSIGSVNSAVRTAEQSDIARFWTTNPVAQYNIAFEQVAVERGLDAVETARLFAMGNLVGSDALIACFDAKYHHLFWRPQFAVQQGDSDGNPATAGDPTWKPLFGAPAHAEYPSGHGCLTGAEAEVFAAFFGTREIGITLKSTASGVQQPTRYYRSVNDLTKEVADARVWGGIHFRTATVKGIVVGRKVAHWALKYHFLPATAQVE